MPKFYPNLKNHSGILQGSSENNEYFLSDFFLQLLFPLYFFSLVRNAIAKTSDRVHGTDKFELSPHMTLIKVNRQIARFRNSKYLPSVLYESHLDANFGVQKVDNLQLCVLEASTRFDGFYRTLSELKFD